MLILLILVGGKIDVSTVIDPLNICFFKELLLVDFNCIDSGLEIEAHLFVKLFGLV
jgi:hypothetical protein